MIKKKSVKERREALRQRTISNAKNKESMGKGGKGILNLEDYSDLSYYKPKEGKNIIDIIPWIVQTDTHPDGMEIGDEDYILKVWVHFGVGPMSSTYVCLERTFGKPCPICEEMKALKDDENATDDQINKLKPKHRAFYNVIDLKAENKGIQLFHVSHWNFEKELADEAETAEEEIIVFSDLKEGRSVRFRANEVQRKGFKPYLEYKSFSFEDRDEYEESIQEETIPLDKVLYIPTYDEVKAAFLNLSIDDINNKKEDTLPRKSREVPFEVDEKIEEEGNVPITEMTKKELRIYIKENQLDIKITREMSTGDIVKLIEGTDEKEPILVTYTCPHGHKFGIDIDDHNECFTCEIFQECSDSDML